MIDLNKKYRTYGEGREVTNLRRNEDPLSRTCYPFIGTVYGTSHTWTAEGKCRLSSLAPKDLDLVEASVSYVKTDEFKTWQLGIIGVVGRLQTEVAKLTDRFETAIQQAAERVKTLTRHEADVREHHERLLKLEAQLKPKAAPLPQRPGWVTTEYNLPVPGIKVLCQVFYQDTGLTYFSVLTYTGTSWETQSARRTGARSFRRPFTPGYVVRAWTYVEGLQ